jgi:hypothetical protein
LADGATEQAPGSAVGSLAPAGTSPSPNPRRCRAPQAPSTGPRFGGPVCSRVVVVVQDVCPVPPCRGGPVQVLGRVHASTRPVSGVRVTVRCPRRCPRIRCPMSGCGRPGVPGSGVRASAVSAPVTSWSASVQRAATRPGGPGSGRPAVSANGTTIGLSQGGFCSGLSGVAADACSGCRRRPRSVVTVEGPGPSRLVAASLPSWTATCACGRSAAATSGERRQLDADDALTCWVVGWR